MLRRWRSTPLHSSNFFLAQVATAGGMLRRWRSTPLHGSWTLPNASTCPSVHLSVCLSVRLSVCLSVCLVCLPFVHVGEYKTKLHTIYLVVKRSDTGWQRLGIVHMAQGMHLLMEQHPFLCLPLCLSVCLLSVCLFACTHACPLTGCSG